MSLASDPTTVAYPDMTTWSLDRLEVGDRSEAWAATLTKSFFPWSLRTRVDADFTADLRQREFGGYRLSRCACGPTSGRRATAEIAQTGHDYYAILYLLKGEEIVRIGEEERFLTSGQLLLWDSEKPMEFEVRSQLEKLTLLTPASSLEAVFPFARDHVGQTVDGSGGPGALFAHHLCALEQVGWTLEPDTLERSMRGTLELFSQAFAAERSGDATMHKRLMFERIRQYALHNLGDPELTPTRLAEAHGISVRYLHLLFKHAGATAGAWLRRERLQRCRVMLESPSQRWRSVTDIALSWGFHEMSHFSKAFRAEFGLSPREARRKAKTDA